MFAGDKLSLPDQLRRFTGEKFLLQARRHSHVLKTGKELGSSARTKMRKQFWPSNRGEFFAQASGLLIELSQLRLLPAPGPGDLDASHGLQRCSPRIHVTTKNSFGFGNDAQEN